MLEPEADRAHLVCSDIDVVKGFHDIFSEDMEKAQRWLGFIQGVLFAKGVYDLCDLRIHTHGSEAQDVVTHFPSSFIL